MSDSAGGSKKRLNLHVKRNYSGAWPVYHVVFGCLDGGRILLAVKRAEIEGQRE